MTKALLAAAVCFLLAGCVECELEWDAGRARYYVWCDGHIVGTGETKEAALNEYEAYKKRAPSWRVPIKP